MACPWPPKTEVRSVKYVSVQSGEAASGTRKAFIEIERIMPLCFSTSSGEGIETGHVVARNHVGQSVDQSVLAEGPECRMV